MAVKVLIINNKNKNQVIQVQKEINILKKLRHRNIIRYYGCELNSKCLKIYLEYAGLKSIDILLKEYGPF